jgi:hypothetical protein
MTLTPEDRQRIEENRAAIRRAEEQSRSIQATLAEAQRVRNTVVPRLLRAVRAR